MILHPPVTTPPDTKSKAGKLRNYTFSAEIGDIVMGNKACWLLSVIELV